MNKKTLVTLIVFVVLGVVAWQVLKAPPKGQRAGEKKRPLPKLAVKSIEKVTISRKDKPKVVLAHEGGKWQLLEPVKYAADGYASKRLGEALEKLELGDLVTNRKDRHGQYQVDPASSVRVTVEGGGKALADLHLGKSASGFTMVRLEGKDEVWQAVGSIRATFVKDVKSWRDRSVLKLDRKKVRRLSVTTKEGEIVLARKDDKDASWKVEKSAPPVDQLDVEVAKSLIAALSAFVAGDFADEAKPDQTGFDQPQAKVVIGLDGGKQHEVLLGREDKGNFYVKLGDKPQVFTIKQYAANNLLKRPIDFRDKTILAFKAEDLVELQLTHVGAKDSKRTTTKLTRKGADWLKDGKKLADKPSKKVAAAAKALASLKADRFARFSAAELGMAKPAWTLALRLKDRTRHQLSVGPNNKDGFFGVQRKGVADLFACRQYKLNKFLLKPDAFK